MVPCNWPMWKNPVFSLYGKEKVSIKETGRGKSTIMRLFTAARELPPIATPQHEEHPGRSRKTTPHPNYLLKLTVNRNPWLTAEDLKEVYPILLKDVTIRTSQHRLKYYLGIPSRVAARKPMKDTKRCKQDAVVKGHKYWSVSDWQKILWSNESNLLVVTSHILRIRCPLSRNQYDHRYPLRPWNFLNDLGLFQWECGEGWTPLFA